MSANMINNRMVLLKINLFILNINSVVLFRIYAAVEKSAPYFTAIRDNNPTLPELLHESID
jgi:hypothetical protein